MSAETMSAETTSVQADPLARLGERIETAAGSLGDAATNATASAKVAARKVKDAAHSGAYHSAYGVAFGVVFSAVFLVELLPANNVFRRGFEDGAEEGFDAAIAKSAARNSKRRELIESAEELPLEIDDTPPTPRERAETVRAPKTKRARASK
jgi:hypothetical protein